MLKRVEHLYSIKPDGYCGDEDNGQPSAWYVISALGFYPMCPGFGCFFSGWPVVRREAGLLHCNRTRPVDCRALCPS